jgi:hypothetical protein
MKRADHIRKIVVPDDQIFRVAHRQLPPIRQMERERVKPIASSFAKLVEIHINFLSPDPAGSSSPLDLQNPSSLASTKFSFFRFMRLGSWLMNTSGGSQTDCS